MKKVLVLISLFLCATSIVAQSQNDYYDDRAVAGGADKALNGIIIIILIVVGLIALVILGNVFFKIMFWFSPKKETAVETQRKKEIKEKNENTIEKQLIIYSETKKKCKEVSDQQILDEDRADYHFLIIPQSPVIEISSENKKYIEKIKDEYALTEKKEDDDNNGIVDWGVNSNKEHDELDEGDAYYSYDGKKFLYFSDNLSEYEVRNGVQIITDRSFAYGCMGKERVDIKLPSTVIAIGNDVFHETHLNSFEIPKSVTSITGNPFVKCSINLINKSPFFTIEKGVLYDKGKKRVISVLCDSVISLDPNVIVIGRYSLYGKTSVDSKINLPIFTKYIGDSSFKKTTFTEVKMPDGIIEIGEKAFAFSKVKEIKLPTSLLKLNKSAFEGCNNLECIYFSGNLKVIEENTFAGCTNLKYIYIPEGIKVLKKLCFEGCVNLKIVRFPNSLERIETLAFDLCPLENVVVSKETFIEEGAFPSQCKILFR